MSAPATNSIDVEVQDYKVFVGNLAFSTTADDLKNVFAKAGNVVSSNIISRHTRSLGYGFISFVSEADANQAVALLNKTELSGRTLSVEHVKPRSTEARPKNGGRRRRAPVNASQTGGEMTEGAAPAEGAIDASVAASGADSSDAVVAASAAPRPRKPRQRRRKPAPKTDDGEEVGDATSASADTAAIDTNSGEAARIDEAPVEGDAKPRRTRGPRRRRKPAANATGPVSEGDEPTVSGDAAGPASVDASESVAAPAIRRRRRHRSIINDMTEAEQSKTLLFVANLPFNVDNQSLRDIFKDFAVKSAKVMTMRNGRSKGFGFVQLESEAEMARVLDDFDHVEVDGRQLVIRIAHASSEQNAPTAEGEEKIN